MEGREGSSPTHWLSHVPVHAEGPLGAKSDIRACLVSPDLGGPRGGRGSLRGAAAAYTAKAHLSVLVLALCSSTQLCRTCMRRGADYHHPAWPASQGFLGKGDHHSLRLSPHGGDGAQTHACSPSPPRQRASCPLREGEFPVLSSRGHVCKRSPHPPCLPAVPWHLPPLLIPTCRTSLIRGLV